MISLFETGQSLRFADDGLIPAIIQDSITKNVLMLGYMNEEAISLTRSTGLVTFFSRSKNRIWQKGETSGNVLRAKEIRVDCDGDTLLILASPVGPTCHTGTDTCWAEENEKSPISFLSDLKIGLTFSMLSKATPILDSCNSICFFPPSVMFEYKRA